MGVSCRPAALACNLFGALLVELVSLGFRQVGGLMSIDTAVIRGTLDLLILRVLTLEPMHGWGISERIQALSVDALRAQQGSLYASLHRLTREGWIRSYWEDTDSGRRARYYALTKAGLRQTAVETDRWLRLSAGVGRLIASTS
jgi:transcriptional regulator